VRFTPRVRDPGRYAVYLYWPRAAGLGERVPVSVRHAEGTADVPLDMRAPTAEVQGGLAQWNLLGEWEFRPDAEAWIELRAEPGAGAVVADAVLLVPVARRE
jgi:hypothetical protein